MGIAVKDEHLQWEDIDGLPIVAGSLYFGDENQNPVQLPEDITYKIYSDEALTIELPNPIATNVYGRAAQKVYVAGKYSIALLDSEDAQVYINLSSGSEELYTKAEIDEKTKDKYFNTLIEAQAVAASLRVGNVLILKERTAGNGGGFTGDVIADVGGVAATAEGGFSLIYLGSDLSLQIRLKSTIYVDQLGGNDATDGYPACQKAVDIGEGKIIQFDSPEYIMNTGSLNLKTKRIYQGLGHGGSSTRITAGPGLFAITKPTITANTYTPVLDFVPIAYNSDAIQNWAMRDLLFDGNSEDVFGLVLHENYYGNISNVRITSCNKHPYINVRGQAVNHESFSCYFNGDGAVSYDTTSFNFQTPAFEGNGGAWSYQQRQPVSGFNKGSMQMSGAWFETGTITAQKSTVGHLLLSGRGVDIDTPFMKWSSPAGTEIGIQFAGDNDEALTLNGINMATQKCVGANVERCNQTVPLVNKFGATTDSYYLSGWFDASLIEDNNGGSNNGYQPYGSGVDLSNSAIKTFQVRVEDSGSGMPVGVDDVYFGVDGDNIKLFRNAGNFIRRNSGNLEFGSAIKTRFLSSDDVDFRSGNSAGHNVTIKSQDGVSTWERGHWELGGYHFWMDGNDFYGSIGAPTSATDGTLIATLT